MWCKQCRQDVPALAVPGQRVLSCPRCGDGVFVEQAVTGAASNAAPAASQAPVESRSGNPFPYDSWEIDEELRHIGRVLGEGDGTRRRTEPVARALPAARLDAPHARIPPWHVAGTAEAGTIEDGRARPILVERASHPGGTSILAVVGWAALSLGTMALCCGGILLAWSALTGRQELWNIGVPVAVGGQIALVIGLVLQLDRLWHDGRHAADKLDRVGQQLHELKAATAMLGTSHASPGAAFYSHMLEGANPQILLTDLKGQLDLLAVKISQS